MIPSDIRTYLLALRRRLWFVGLVDSDAIAELETHLLEAVDEGLRQGLTPVEAEQRALARFGAIDQVADAFANERLVQMQYVLLGLGAIAGLFMTYVDSRPHWDDTGITAGVLFLSAGLLTLLGFRRPWLMGLAVGIWLPAYYIFRSHDLMMLVVLLIPLAGAYLGWGLRWGLRKALRLA